MQAHRLLLVCLFGGSPLLDCSLARAAAPRHPLPTAAELQAAESRATDAAKAALAAQGKADDAQALFDWALGLEDDPVGQCALLIRVRQRAQAAGEVSLSLAAIDALGERFEFDVMASKASVLEDLAKTDRTKAARRLTHEEGLRLREEALAAERFELAERFANAAANNYHALRWNRRGSGNIVNYVRKCAEAQRQAAADARERLQTEPDDPQAHAAIGLHMCFPAGNWAEGAKHLEKSADARLVALVRDELAPPQDARGQLALADAWWSAALEPERADQRAPFILRAVHWYRRALAGLDGQAKVKAEERVNRAMSVILWGERPVGRPFRETIELSLADEVVLRLVQVPRGNGPGGAADSFYLSDTEITQEQWLTLMPKNPSSQQGDSLLPVHDLTQDEAEEFAKALNHAGVAEGFLFRLPTPEEWLHACFGGYSVRGSQARGIVDRQAWRQANSEGRLHPVGTLRPCGRRLFDMLGNCAEWTTDPSRVFGYSYADPIHATKLFKQTPAVNVPAGHHGPTIGFRIAADRRDGGQGQ